MKLSPREKETFQLHSEALTSCLLNYSKVNAKTVKQWSITATLCYTRSLQIKSFPVAWVGSLFICNSCLQKPQNQNPSACLEHRVSDTLPSHPPMGPSGCLGPQVPSREGGAQRSQGALQPSMGTDEPSQGTTLPPLPFDQWFKTFIIIIQWTKWPVPFTYEMKLLTSAPRGMAFVVLLNEEQTTETIPFHLCRSEVLVLAETKCQHSLYMDCWTGKVCVCFYAQMHFDLKLYSDWEFFYCTDFPGRCEKEIAW